MRRVYSEAGTVEAACNEQQGRSVAVAVAVAVAVEIKAKVVVAGLEGELLMAGLGFPK